jgi:hypothetical protein
VKKYCVVIYGEVERVHGLELDEAEILSEYEYRVNQRETRIEEEDDEEEEYGFKDGTRGPVLDSIKKSNERKEKEND